MKPKLPHHKARPPLETVDRAREALGPTALFPTEWKWNVFSDDCGSVLLEDINLPALFVNGKGVTRELALASAYGELLERVQAGFLVPKGFGLMEDRPFYHPDECSIPVRSLRSSLGTTCDPLFYNGELPWKALEDVTTELRCAPFYDVRNRRVAELPVDLLRSSLSTNGTCAGNSPEEALVHGLCEVMERFVTREVLTRVPLELPDIPLAVFRPLESYRLIEQLQQRGYEVLIKDCTLGGRFPALGLALKPKGKSLYRYKIGCDPILEVALQRCFTEALQGLSAEALQGVSADNTPHLFGVAPSDARASWIERYQGFVRFMSYRLARLPEGLVRHCGAPYDLSPFEDRFVSHRHSLSRAIRALLDDEHDIFIRASGFLGFPAYWVYIPRLSPFYLLNEETLELFFRHRSFVMSCLMRSEERTASELRRCASLLVRARLHNQFLRLFPYDFYPGYRNLDEDRILFFLFARAGALDEAREHLRAHLGRLGGGIGESLAEGLLNDPGSVAKGFERFPWPQCGDCTRCPAAESCFFPAWQQIDRSLVRCMEAHPIDQAALEGVFC